MDQRSERFGFTSRREGHTYIFELEFSDNQRLVAIVRRFVEEYYGALFTDEETLSRLALVTHELMENAMRYSNGGMARLAVEYDPLLRRVWVRSFNQTSAQHADAVGRLVEGLARAEDPMALYVGLMRDTASRAEGSGLGLARIRVEAEMELSHRYQAGCLNITASAQIGGIQ